MTRRKYRRIINYKDTFALKLSLQDIYSLLKAHLTVSLRGHGNNMVSTLLCDSRELNFARGTLFFALRTSTADGHRFIGELYNRGVRNFVVEKDYTIPETYADADFLLVDSPLTALQVLAAGVRETLPELVSIGITGSRGKTQIKEMIYEMLRHETHTVRSPRSYNSQIGVPLSLWQLEQDTRIGVFEAGISCPGEMSSLQYMIQPTVGVFTSLTDEHSENFTSQEQKASEKAQLFSSARVIVYPEGDETILKAIERANPTARLVATRADNRSIARAAAHEAAREAGFSITDAEMPLSQISTRIDVLQALKDCLLIFDTFTHDERSLYEALNFMLKRATPQRTSTLILAPVSDLDTDGYRRVAQMISDKGVERLIIVGSLPGASAEILRKAVRTFDIVADSREFIKNYSISDFCSELILIKGSNSEGFDEITAHLEAPRHETIMEVNLNALINNYNYFKSKLPRDTGLITMVKADAYGVGALEVSKTMQSQGAAMLAVAVVDEGVALRRAGVTMPIIVMNPMGTNYKALFDYHLEPSVFSMGELDTLLRYAEIYDVSDYPVHIKLDTGMHRLGFLPDELDALTDALNAGHRLRPASVFSHLATADCLDMDIHTEAQIKLYTAGAEKLSAGLAYPVKRHLLNTAGILRFADYPSDMARLGIGLYGLSPLPSNIPVPLQNVASLITTIISLRRWSAGTAIGYSRKGVTSRDSIIATIPIGYADGMDRRLGNGNATVRINGTECPTVGNICMDQCMVDVTEANAKLGDKVIIFDSATDILRLADTLGTIPYEILTSISPRVKRIYFRE